MTLALARLESRHLEQPQTRAFDVITTLADFAILTRAVEPAALARHLAPGFEPDIRTLDDGRQVALVSAVPSSSSACHRARSATGSPLQRSKFMITLQSSLRQGWSVRPPPMCSSALRLPVRRSCAHCIILIFLT